MTEELMFCRAGKINVIPTHDSVVYFFFSHQIGNKIDGEWQEFFFV